MVFSRVVWFENSCTLLGFCPGIGLPSPACEGGALLAALVGRAEGERAPGAQDPLGLCGSCPAVAASEIFRWPLYPDQHQL